MTLALTASEPVLVPSGVFLVERRLAVPGEVRVRLGERVEPATVVAVAASAAGRPITLYPARELGVASGSVRRYLTKPIGSSFEAGEAVARARRGLRTVSVTAPVPGTLGEVDE
ncbi:MAG: hypothetical protein IRY97_08690, partial [Thermomicrobiaceae bacterium]|nr:hypothetical protein [Thermomicrobiaceae bacterium]